MRFALLAVLCIWSLVASGQRPQPPEEITAEKPAAKPADKQKARPRVTLKPKGGTGSNVGDDAAGGGARSAEPSKGGTPGTPSGSFTGTPSRP